MVQRWTALVFISVPNCLFSVWYLTRFQLEASPWIDFFVDLCVCFGPILDSWVHFLFQLVLTFKEEKPRDISGVNVTIWIVFAIPLHHPIWVHCTNKILGSLEEKKNDFSNLLLICCNSIKQRLNIFITFSCAPGSSFLLGSQGTAQGFQPSHLLFQIRMTTFLIFRLGEVGRRTLGL